MNKVEYFGDQVNDYFIRYLNCDLYVYISLFINGLFQLIQYWRSSDVNGEISLNRLSLKFIVLKDN